MPRNALADNTMDLCPKHNKVFFICPCPKKRLTHDRVVKYHGMTSEELTADLKPSDLRRSVMFEDKRPIQRQNVAQPGFETPLEGIVCPVVVLARQDGRLGRVNQTISDAMPFEPTHPNYNVW